RSWVLVDEEKNTKCNFESFSQIRVTNSINEEVPFLRQSLSVSLIQQFENYLKNYVEDVMLFEEGKVFGKNSSGYIEINKLGMLEKSSDIKSLQLNMEKVLGSVGVENIIYKTSDLIP